MKILFSLRSPKIGLLALALALLTPFTLSCSKMPAHKGDGQPSLSVWGFSCELGAKACENRMRGRQMKEAASQALENTGRFRLVRAETANRKHLMDVSDMLWQSGETSLLEEMYSLVDTDYLVYGRVFHYDPQTRFLQVELSLVHVSSRRTLSQIGEGTNGSLNGAVKDAIAKLNLQLDQISAWN